MASFVPLTRTHLSRALLQLRRFAENAVLGLGFEVSLAEKGAVVHASCCVQLDTYPIFTGGKRHGTHITDSARLPMSHNFLPDTQAKGRAAWRRRRNRSNWSRRRHRTPQQLRCFAEDAVLGLAFKVSFAEKGAVVHALWLVQLNTHPIFPM